MAVVHRWGDGGHVGEVWFEGYDWHYALVHVPTGEILARGKSARRYNATQRLRYASERFGLQPWPPARWSAQVVRLRSRWR